MIQNPILPGFHPDPCITRRGEDYYICVSSFEWMPGLPVYHSKDLHRWELAANIITSEAQAELRKLPASKGIWAPSLTWCEADGLFYVVYGIMNSMNARYFDVDNYLITAPEITGPWSEPVYLHSAGFDASILHDDDGSKYIVSLEWETREGYQKPGGICLCEYDAATKTVKGYPKRISMGATKRGCLEAPHLTKHEGFYYLMCAEGGTGYYHGVTMQRAKQPFGPYEGDPNNPIVTSNPTEADERADTDHLKPRYFWEEAPLQKSGHGSYVQTPQGEVYLVHLCSRPFVPELRCTLGRESAIQKMKWSPDGWLRMEYGGNIAQLKVIEPRPFEAKQNSPERNGNNSDSDLKESLIEENSKHFDSKDSQQETERRSLVLSEEIVPDDLKNSQQETESLSLVFPEQTMRDDFDEETLPIFYYAPRILPESFAKLGERMGYLRIRGQESPASLNRVSLLARKLTGLSCTVTTKMDFTPKCYQHSAGLILYYDNVDFLYLRKYYSETLGQSALSIIQIENGVKTEHLETRIPVTEKELYLRLSIQNREVQFFYGYEEEKLEAIGEVFDLSKLSDEYCSEGEFTGTMVGMIACDRLFHRECADFDFFEYRVDK